MQREGVQFSGALGTGAQPWPRLSHTRARIRWVVGAGRALALAAFLLSHSEDFFCGPPWLANRVLLPAWLGDESWHRAGRASFFEAFVSWKMCEDPEAKREPLAVRRWPAAFAECGVCTPGCDCLGSSFLRCVRFQMSVGPAEVSRQLPSWKEYSFQEQKNKTLENIVSGGHSFLLTECLLYARHWALWGTDPPRARQHRVCGMRATGGQAYSSTQWQERKRDTWTAVVF